MEGNKKSKAGRKPGHPISPAQFQNLVDALGMSRDEIAKLCDSSLTPQAVSWWGSQGRIPRMYLNKLAGELEKRVGQRKPTKVEWAAMNFLRSAEITAKVEEATGSAIPYVKSAFGPHSFLVPLQSVTGTAETQALSDIKDADLIRELESRGYVIGLKLNKTHTEDKS